MAQYPQRIGEPDCRDYLRTGRCKYGESCKYHHPPNVQSGGGIKTPLNPSEPPFPIRPGEPPCQYYLKHGTCKFGQTCKFHHPPNIIATSGTGSLPGTFLVNVGGTNILTKPTMQRGGGQPILLNANGADVAEHSQQGTMLQILPQRPNEPDCIYFLRNGRCKYGATCKYHHPMNTNTVQQVESTGVGRKPQTVQLHLQPQSRTGRGRAYSTGSVSEVNNIRSLQLIQQTPTGHGHHGQQTQSQNYVGNSGVGPTHILVADGPISVMTVDQVGSTAPAYQQINSMGNQLYSQPEDSTGSDVGDSRHEHSPQMTSSVASSYETAVSSYEFMAQGNRNQQVSAEAGSAHWPRTNSQQHLPSMGTPQRQGPDTLRTSTSGGSLHSYQSADTMSGAQAHGHYGSMRGNRAQIARSSGSIAGDGVHQHQLSSLRLAVDAANRSNQQQEQERRLRAVSVGSTGEGSLMYSSVNEVTVNVRQESIARGWPSSSSLPTSTINIATDRTQTLWEEQNMDHAAGYSNDSPYPDASENASAMNRDQGSKQHSQYRQNDSALHRQDKNSHLEDDGLSMMTSALLNMLDTPDEDGSGRQTNRGTALSNNFSSASVSSHVGVSASRQRMSLSAPNTPIMNSSRRPRAVSAVDEFVLSGGNNGDHPPQHRAPSHFPRTFQNDVNSSQGVEMDFTGNSLPSHHQAHSFDSRYYLDTPDNYRSASPPEHTSAAPSRWSPTLCDPDPSSHQLERNAQSVSALQQPPGTTPSASQGTPNIGLFLS